MYFLKIRITAICFFFTTFYSFAQLDSLKHVASKESSETGQIIKLNELSKKYFRLNMEISIELLNTALLLSEKIENKKAKAPNP